MANVKPAAVNRPEIYAFELRLNPLQEGYIPMAHGYHAGALFLNIISTSSPALAEKLHDADTVKPYTVSTLQGKIKRRGGELKIETGAAISLRITFLNSEVFTHFIDGAIKWGDKPVDIAGIPFSVVKVQASLEGGNTAGFSSYRDIQENAAASRKIDLRFLTPTVFRSGGKRNNIFPEPALVFGSYWNRWQALSPLKLDESLPEYFRLINVTRYRLETALWDFGAYQELGYCGTCRFEVEAAVEEAVVRQINALADFAPFCGTGAKTAMGMGQTRREQYAGTVSNRAGNNLEKKRCYPGNNQK